MTGNKQKIINKIAAISTAKSPYEVYNDWIKCTALSIVNTCSLPWGKVWKEREAEYNKTIKPYGEAGFNDFAEMTGLLIDLIEQEGLNDWLGEIFMELSLGNKFTAQLFTPFTVCQQCAEMTLEGVDLSKPKLRMYEPCSGGGIMIIAIAEALKKRGINYQKRLYVVAQDIDIKTVYMCYAQLALMGIRADVIVADTLKESYDRRNIPPERIYRTPARMGLLDFVELGDASQLEAARADEPPCIPQQGKSVENIDTQEPDEVIKIDSNGQQYQTITLF